jgi:hypothetical protein
MASAKEIFGGDDALIDCLAQGMKIDMNLDIWKTFFNIQKNLFEDENFILALVPYLFGLTPATMMHMSGNLAF